MRIIFIRFFFVCLAACGLKFVAGQCEIQNRINPDGTMFFFAEPTLIWGRQPASLRTSVVTDKEHYFIAFEPDSFPPDPKGFQLKYHALVELSNHKEHELEFFFSLYRKFKEDTVSRFVVIFTIPKELMGEFIDHDLQVVKIKPEEEEKFREFRITHNKGVIRKQIQCLKESK